MDFYKKNLDAIKQNNVFLYEKLNSIYNNDRYEVFLPQGYKYPNILDKKNNAMFYQDSQDEIEIKKEHLKELQEYPFLYFFGIADGSNIKELLKNKNLQQLLVIEPELELLYVALNVNDFSKDLEKNRLLFLEKDDINRSTIVNLFHNLNAKYYIKVFRLHLINQYYEQFYIDEYKKLYGIFLDALDYFAQANGNDINDTFTGVIQHIQNLDIMLENLPYSQLKKAKNSNLAVIVSTGPSLTKQLPLLKEYQDKITIISVDASLPILLKNGIIPDIVTSMERDEPTSVFFKDVDYSTLKETIFICASLQHKSVFDAIKSDKLMVVMRPFAYNIYFDFDDYGYVCMGMSSANMAHEVATAMRFDQITFIGQNLAFGDDLKTHADDHIIESDPDLDAQIQSGKLFDITAYGAEGKVKTNIFWNIFKNFIEQHIDSTKNIVTSYNSTQGGARIEGSIEIDFKDVLSKYANTTKKPLQVSKPSSENIEVLKSSKEQKLQFILDESKELQEQINRSFLIIADASKDLENKSIDECLEIFDISMTIKLLDEISKIRKEVENSKIYYKFLESIIQPLMYSMELEIGEIKVKYVNNPKDNTIKALQWILAHRYWLFSLSGVIENVIHLTQENIKS